MSLRCMLMCGLLLFVTNAARAAQSRGYLGVDVVSRAEGIMVWRVLPGPLDGGLVSSESLARGDLIVSIDGTPVTKESWDALPTRAVGTPVRVAYRAGEPRGVNGQPRTDGELREVTIIIADGDLWRGTMGKPALPALVLPPLKNEVDTTALAVASEQLGPLAKARSAKLVESLGSIVARHGDPSTPPLLRAVFGQPSQTEALVRAAIPEAVSFRATPFRTAAMLVTALAGNPTAPLPEPQGVFKIDHADAGVWYLDFLLNGARAKFDESINTAAATMPGLRALVVERLDDLMVRGPHAADAMRALPSLPSMGPLKAAQLLAHFEVVAQLDASVAASPTATLPEPLVGAVTGSIVAASEIAELGWVVVGGTGDNHYDLSRVAAVLDLGGNDSYAWNHAQAQHRLVVDFAGNDAHTGGAIGPAGSLGAISIIDDHAGNDRYEGSALTAGTALGLSVILDRAGDDRYSAGAWSLGAAAGGAAVVIDLAGTDHLEAEGMAIGVGGPSGVGAFVDLTGDDFATLGTRGSVYGVAGEHAGFGMGLGLGFRLSAAGGVGAYLDYEGRDHRHSGEFSQGCGYFLGLGISFDGSGDDLSAADRYGIGSAAHQAAGVAIDLAGNDCYIGRTAAHVGAAWDESLGYFVDAAGDDSYRVDGLSLGAAAQQAVGIAIDRAGADQYRGGGAFLGAASGNEYHFDATGLGSLGLFFDLAGFDLYPAARKNDASITSPEAPSARLSDCDSLFFDAASVAPSPNSDAKPI